MEKVKDVDDHFVLIRMHEEYWKMLEDMKKGKYNGGSICRCGNLIEPRNGLICKDCIEDYL